MNADLYHESRQLWKALWAYLFLTMFFLLAAAVTASSQTTWDGSHGTAWTDANNWSAGVPDANDNVTIPLSIYNSPVISTASAVAKSVTVAPGGSLTVNAAGNLAIDGPGLFGIQIVGTVTNNGTITINGSTDSGIYSQSNGSFINSGTITIGAVTSVGEYGIRNYGGTINNSGSISIDRSTSSGIYNIGIFTN